MSPIYASVTKPEYSIEDGKYPAILFQIIQLGSQKFGKDTPKPWYSPQILLGFELPTLTYETQNGEVSSIKSGTYFISMNPTRNGMLGLREIIDGMRGSSEYTAEELEKFDISAFLGKQCEIEISGVESKGKTYQNITKVEPYQGAQLQPMRTPILVTVEDFKNLEELNLPDWIINKIMDSKEYQEMNGESTEVDIDAIDTENTSNIDAFNASLEKSRELPAKEVELKLDEEEEGPTGLTGEIKF